MGGEGGGERRIAGGSVVGGDKGWAGCGLVGVHANVKEDRVQAGLGRDGMPAPGLLVRDPPVRPPGSSPPSCASDVELETIHSRCVVGDPTGLVAPQGCS